MAESDGLENRCVLWAPWVQIPLPPPPGPRAGAARSLRAAPFARLGQVETASRPGRAGRVLALVTNDDGIDSEGLRALATAAVDAGLEVLVAAVIRRVIPWTLADHDRPVVLNVNVPDMAEGSLRGMHHARLAPYGAVQARSAHAGAG